MGAPRLYNQKWEMLPLLAVRLHRVKGGLTFAPAPAHRSTRSHPPGESSSCAPWETSRPFTTARENRGAASAPSASTASGSTPTPISAHPTNTPNIPSPHYRTTTILSLHGGVKNFIIIPTAWFSHRRRKSNPHLGQHLSAPRHP